VNVLITGETGTGKELVAQAIHTASPRDEQNFVCVNCAALPDSLVESELFGHARGAFTGAHQRRAGKLKHSDRGTVFLDEVGELSLFAQAKLLRAIETRQIESLGEEAVSRVDFRLVAATNRTLDDQVRQGVFRGDLYYRINVARIHIPPLRERIEDLPCLIAHYLPRLNREFGMEVRDLDPEAFAVLRRYSWPGNVRELRNILETAYLSVEGSYIRTCHLPHSVLETQWVVPARHSERERLVAALNETNWNKKKAADKMQWSRMTLYRKLAKHGLASNGTSGES
jgi:two-component system response regulator HydG/two-component system response regulator AtoC